MGGGSHLLDLFSFFQATILVPSGNKPRHQTNIIYIAGAKGWEHIMQAHIQGGGMAKATNKWVSFKPELSQLGIFYCLVADAVATSYTSVITVIAKKNACGIFPPSPFQTIIILLIKTIFFKFLKNCILTITCNTEYKCTNSNYNSFSYFNFTSNHPNGSRMICY